MRRGFADGGMPDIGEPLVGDGGQFSPGTAMGNRVADVGSNVGFGVMKGLGNAAMVPGRVLASREPMTTEQMVGPATDMASLVTLGAGAIPAETNALRAGLGAGKRLGDKPTAEQVAEKVWQSNNGKLKKAEVELGRMRTFADRFGYTPEELASIEALVREKATRPFVSQAKLDRMAEEAADAAERTQKAEGGPVSDPAMKVARDVAAEGGDEGVHIGAIRSAVAGRTDHHPMEVPSGCYVIPADIVSSLGEGNTESGFKVLEHMFPHSASLEKAGTPIKSAEDGRAEGGMVSEGGGAVPIMAAGGEFVISPDDIVARWGDLEHGHAFLDHFVKTQRKNLIKTLKGLPGPAQD